MSTCPYAHEHPFVPSQALDLDPTYARLRPEEPLARIRMPYGADGWLATRYADAEAVLADPRFSSAAVVGAAADAIMSNSAVPAEQRQAALVEPVEYIGAHVAERRAHPDGPSTAARRPAT